MPLLELRDIVKQYRNVRAVDHVSFTLEKGAMFGLLGPNGAGKTSLIRIITTITGADSGSIAFDGEPLRGRHAAQIGYLPEERGLYRKMRVGEHLMYLARLKGLTRADARKQLDFFADRFDIGGWWNKKVEELSKGMQQKIQFISTIIHRPILIILDEPFSGLDPINANLIRDEIRRLNSEGATVIFSTHRMEQVEQICSSIVLINKGQKVLEGNVAAIRDRYKRGEFRVTFEGALPTELERRFTLVSVSEGTLVLRADSGETPNNVMRALLNNGLVMNSFEEIKPSLNEVFIQTVNGEANA